MRYVIFIFVVSLLMPASLSAEPPKGYKLVWSDEFDGKALDREKWNYRGLGPRRDAINTKDCVSLDGEGHLVLTTKKVGDEYHTAMIATHDLFEACYGYYECRVKFQTQVGHWSAFWLQSPKFVNGGTPKENGTEIDIFEYLVKNDKTILFNLHWGGYKKEYHKTTGSKYEIKKPLDEFHTVALEWTPEEYVFYVDGEEAWRTQEAVSHIKQFIILSLEVGKWAGEIQEAQLPDHLLFDYVRVYQKKDEENDD